MIPVHSLLVLCGTIDFYWSPLCTAVLLDGQPAPMIPLLL